MQAIQRILPYEYYWQTSSTGTSTANTANPVFSQHDHHDSYLRAYKHLFCSSGLIQLIHQTETITILDGTAGVWTGATDGDWNNCENWDDAQVPGFFTDVVINDANTVNPLDLSTVNDLSAIVFVNSITLDVSAPNNPINTLQDGESLVANTALTLTNGYLSAGTQPFTGATEGRIVVQSSSPTAINYTNGFVNGFLVQSVTGTNAYTFPVGDIADGMNAISVDYTTATGHAALEVCYRSDRSQAQINTDLPIFTAECGDVAYTQALSGSIWRVSAASVDATSTYDVIIEPSANLAGDWRYYGLCARLSSGCCCIRLARLGRCRVCAGAGANHRAGCR